MCWPDLVEFIADAIPWVMWALGHVGIADGFHGLWCAPSGLKLGFAALRQRVTF